VLPLVSLKRLSTLMRTRITRGIGFVGFDGRHLAGPDAAIAHLGLDVEAGHVATRFQQIGGGRFVALPQPPDGDCGGRCRSRMVKMPAASA
jgi:hypothetical protein